MSAKFKKGDKVWASDHGNEWVACKVTAVIPERTERERFMRAPLVTESTWYLVQVFREAGEGYSDNLIRYDVPEDKLIKRTKQFNGF